MNGDGRMNIMLDKNAFMPERAHDLDAGYDLRTPIEILKFIAEILKQSIREFMLKFQKVMLAF